MPDRRFPAPWQIDETEACFIVRDRNKQALAYVYFEEEQGRAIGCKAADPGLGETDSGEYRNAAGAIEAATVLAAIDYREPIRGRCINTFVAGKFSTLIADIRLFGADDAAVTVELWPGPAPKLPKPQGALATQGLGAVCMRRRDPPFSPTDGIIFTGIQRQQYDHRRSGQTPARNFVGGKTRGAECRQIISTVRIATRFIT